MLAIASVMNCHDALLEEEMTAVYLPTGCSKVTNMYFVLLILMSKGYCRPFVVPPSLKIECPYIDNIQLHYRCRNVIVTADTNM